MTRSLLGVAAAATLLGGGPCEGPGAAGMVGRVVAGTWGGENAGLIADTTGAHVHIACTYGNVPGGIELGGGGRFDAPGEYVLRAYPVAVGPSLPARFVGAVVGPVMTLSVTVTDTTADTTAQLGPVTLYFGREPRMQVCPICRNPLPLPPR